MGDVLSQLFQQLCTGSSSEPLKQLRSIRDRLGEAAIEFAITRH
jgi:hypothetical protein